MRVAIGSDHAGFELKEMLTTYLHELKHDATDLGTHSAVGISGISNDMRELLASDEPEARLAVDYFVYRAAKEIGALAAVLGGLDGLVFTAGIGENSAERASSVRSARIVDGPCPQDGFGG